MIKTLELPVTCNRQYWGQLYGASLSLAIAEHCQNQQTIHLIITPDNLSAYQTQQELQFFLSQSDHPLEVIHFPDWETLPYDHFSPHQDIISQRLATLARLPQLKQGIVIASIQTLMHRLSPLAFIKSTSFMMEVGQKLNTDALRSDLIQANYHSVNKVMEYGEFAIRGSIIDIYPMGSSLPFRIDLFDDEIDSIRTFCVETQRSIEKVPTITVLPAKEFPLNQESITHFRKAFRQLTQTNPSHCPLYENVSEGIAPNGIEYYLPLFFDELARFFDYLPQDSEIFLIEDCLEQGKQFWSELTERHHQRNYDISRPILSPESCFIPLEELMQLAKNHQLVHCYHKTLPQKASRINANTIKAAKLPIERKAAIPLNRLKSYLEQNTKRILFIAESAGRREVLLELLSSIDCHPHKVQSWQAFLNSNEAHSICIGPVHYGVELPQAKLSLIVESQLFGEAIISQVSHKHRQIDSSVIIKDLTELRIGSPVVHIEHGIGRYQGLTHIKSGEVDNEFLILQYSGDDKIYVPVTSLHLISRYTGGDPDAAPLTRLGSEQWQKAKKKAAEKIHDVAIELLDIYAKREARVGFCYQYDKAVYQNFSSGFPFEETPDQLQAINNIIADMHSDKPMDRLICGDVGFGKTEVAMRAAFIAVQNNKQVCILVPTTLLAGQHYDNFCDRFADFPVNIELLSRFKTGKQSSSIVAKIASGGIDIIIATHKILQTNIQFKHLGLLIIDEEHRFGVKQKEAIKAMRNEIDILSMTATPIPRTMNMAMSGLRDISLIATPPAKRLAIKTFWQQSNHGIIREAILREILRGGQVYYLHNNVQTIERTAHDLTKLVPEAKITLGHGQMRERQLERVMSDFYHHRYNVLVCTTIIETGIDIPTANTIIIDRADKFGLAQLHQLRGRVGRSHHQAYAYLLTPDVKAITADAKKRLEAITSLEDLGAGFSLATHDLEIRGAGELLGQEQSGNMQDIGFNLYMELLDKAVADLKSGKKPELDKPFHSGAEIDLKISTVIPKDYIGDIHLRLTCYKRIANAETKAQLKDLQIEWIDRFGLLPDSVKNLIRVTEIKLLAQTLNLTKITANQEKGKIEFADNADIDPKIIIQLIQRHPKRYRLDGPNRLRFHLDQESSLNRIDQIQQLLLRLKPDTADHACSKSI